MMRREGGFTLLEVLVAILLASLLLSTIYGVFSTASEAKQKVEKRGNALHLGRILSGRLDRELLGLALDAPPSLVAGRPLLAGGVNDQGESFLDMLTTSSGGPAPGLRWVHYRLGPDQDGLMTLWRSEKGLNAIEDPTEERIAQGIDKMTFGFFDNTGWQPNWLNRGSTRPKLVRVELSLHDLPDEPPLSSVFNLPQ